MTPDVRQHASDDGRVSEPGPRARLTVVLLLGAVVLAACGASASTTTTVGNKLSQPGKVSPAVRAREQALHEQVIAALHAPAPKSEKPGIPGFIPRDTVAVNRVVTATRAHPQLAIAGDSVVLNLASGRTLATMNGPLYNNKYVGTDDPAIPAQFRLTFTATHGAIPLARDDFTILDELGNNIVPLIQVKGGGALPKELRSGRRLTLLMSTIIPVGDGSIVYNPTGFVQAGHKPLVGWDFIVEDD